MAITVRKKTVQRGDIKPIVGDLLMTHSIIILLFVSFVVERTYYDII